MQVFDGEASENARRPLVQDLPFLLYRSAQLGIYEIQRYEVNIVLEQIEHARFERVQMMRRLRAVWREQHTQVEVATRVCVPTDARAE